VVDLADALDHVSQAVLNIQQEIEEVLRHLAYQAWNRAKRNTDA
jgi:hypothetical protein